MWTGHAVIGAQHMHACMHALQSRRMHACGQKCLRNSTWSSKLVALLHNNYNYVQQSFSETPPLNRTRTAIALTQQRFRHMGKGKTYLVSGSSRGVGLALVKELLSKPDNRTVFAAARSPQKSEELQKLAEKHKDRLHIVTFDVTSGDSAKEAAEQVEKIVGGKGLDVLINNAGTSEDLVPPLDTPDEKLKLTFMTNAVGPIIAYKYFKSLLDKGETKMIINFASNYGSITLASEPLKDSSKATPLDHTQIAYKASKAAVNMETVIIAEDTKEAGFTVISLHPGVVDTDMGSRPQEIVDSAKPEISPEDTAKAQVELYDRLTKKDTGKFFGYKGDVLPW